VIDGHIWPSDRMLEKNRRNFNFVLVYYNFSSLCAARKPAEIARRKEENKSDSDWLSVVLPRGHVL
jgi:hypothetical protein